MGQVPLSLYRISVGRYSWLICNACWAEDDGRGPFRHKKLCPVALRERRDS